MADGIGWYAKKFRSSIVCDVRFPFSKLDTTIIVELVYFGFTNIAVLAKPEAVLMP